jgi:heterodisulfide reductase subunit D
VLYYPGCTTATKTHEIPNAVISILEKLKVNYTVLTKEEESCCGLPFYEVGQMEWFEEVAKNTIEYIEQHKPKTIITTCSGCYKFLSKIYPEEIGIKWSGQIIHFTEYIQDELDKNRSMLKPLNLNITYHDPCTLGRGSGLYDPPRKTIKTIPGINIKEMSNIRENQVCCGAGGGVGAAYPSLALNMAKSRLQQAEETGAEALISSCAGCKTNFIAAKDNTKSKMKILDIAELIDEALPS